MFQFCESVDTRLLNKRVLESLVRAGAMDGLGAHRAQMIAVIDRVDGAVAEIAARTRERAARIIRRRRVRLRLPCPPEDLPEVPSGPSTNCSRRNTPRSGFTFPAIRSTNTPGG